MKLNAIETGRIERQTERFKKNTEQTISTPSRNEKKDNKALEKTLIALGAIALGTIAAVTVYRKGGVVGYRKGKIKGVQEGLREGFEGMRNLDLGGFKKVGKFEKGKAFINGKEFSGTIYTPNGYELSYKNGVLSRSVGARSQKDYRNGKLYCADYLPSRRGDVKHVFVERMTDGTVEYNRFLADTTGKHIDKEIILTIKPDGSITKRYTNLKKKAITTNSEYKYDKIIDLKTKKCTGIEIKDVKKAPASVIQHKEHSYVDGKKFTKKYEDGKLIDSYISEYNPKTGIAVETRTNQFGGIDYTVINPKDNTAISSSFGGKSFGLHGKNPGFFESLDELKQWVAAEKINIDSKLIEEIANRIL